MSLRLLRFHAFICLLFCNSVEKIFAASCIANFLLSYSLSTKLAKNLETKLSTAEFKIWINRCCMFYVKLCSFFSDTSCVCFQLREECLSESGSVKHFTADPYSVVLCPRDATSHFLTFPTKAKFTP